MSVFIPLKKVAGLEAKDVGLYAKEFAKLDSVVNIPFTLVISSSVFDNFIIHNNLQELISKEPKSVSDQISFFSEVSNAFFKAKFPQNIVNELKECFELVTLDTSNLSSLTDLAKKHSIISIHRSTDYLDGDKICSGTIYSKDDFILFLELLKSSYVSLFSPSSIKFRQERKIYSFKTSIVISRLPDTQNCFHSTYTPNKMQIQSYVGFLDYSNQVTKDVFEVGVDFLKIEASNINRQDTVSVFNLETNMPQVKNYVSGSSASQSAPDGAILEIGRLTKRVASVTGLNEFSLKAVSAKTSQPTIIELELSASHFEPVKNIEEENTIEGFEFEVSDDLTSQSTIDFVNGLKDFLNVHSKGRFSANVNLALRSLDNEISKESLDSALQTCQEIFKNL